MKQNDLIVLGLAGVAVYMIVKSQGGAKLLQGITGTASAGLRDASKTVSEIMDNTGKAFANGWRYFNDGTAIDPAGNYYQGGQLIWSNPSASGYA
jgi:hypothetical protein